MHWLDLAVIALYGAVVLGIGFVANRRQKTTEDYFLGGRRMRWWAIAVSILATSFSSAALVGGTGQGYAGGLAWLGLQLGDLLGFGLAAILFLPYFAAQPITTAYEYLERRFGVVARSAGSAIFIAQTLVRVGLLVYAPALVIATLLGWDLATAIVATAAAALVYSASGGISAVVWTDVLQMVVVGVAVAVSIGLVVADAGGAGELFEHASGAGRLRPVDPDLPWSSAFSLPWILVAYATLAIGIQGTNQQAVQRYLSCTDLAAARKAAFLAWGIGAAVTASTLVLGVALRSWVELEPGALPEGTSGDAVLPIFIGTRLPIGLRGLMVAAIFAASMSSVDSAIHSMSTATIVDFVRRFRRRPLAPATELRLARGLTALYGVAAIGGALLAARSPDGLLATTVLWLGYFSGPLLGLFVLGMATRRVGEAAAVSAVALAAIGVVAAVLAQVPQRAGFHALWLAPAATATTVVLGLAVAWADARIRPPAAPRRAAPPAPARTR